mmetsp:Transcript_15956/g.45616  ORF Transcript_15956/g.45616 Transcript_15956/m.45616 type:complete len:201 (-) Transcript_15956:432-1034(-)
MGSHRAAGECGGTDPRRRAAHAPRVRRASPISGAEAAARGPECPQPAYRLCTGHESVGCGAAQAWVPGRRGLLDASRHTGRLDSVLPLSRSRGPLPRHRGHAGPAGGPAAPAREGPSRLGPGPAAGHGGLLPDPRREERTSDAGGAPLGRLLLLRAARRLRRPARAAGALPATPSVGVPCGVLRGQPRQRQRGPRALRRH